MKSKKNENGTVKLFQPDNFSQSIIRFKECGSDLKTFSPVLVSQSAMRFGERDGGLGLFSQILAKFFKDFEIVKTYQVDRAEIQTQNYKIQLKDRGKAKTILLKKYKVAPDLEQISFYLDLLDLLRKKGAPVSTVLKTLDGQWLAEIGGELYSAFDFIEGNHFAPTERGFADVAKNLARLHLAFNALDEKILSQIEVLSQKGYYPLNVVKKYSEADLAAFEKKIGRKRKKEKTEEVLLAKLPVFKMAAVEVGKYEERVAKLPRQVIHSDFHAHNVLMDGDKLRAIIDFENVRIDRQIRDVAFAIYKFGKQFFVNSHGGDIASEASRLKDLFIKNYSKIKPLSAEEVALLPVLAKDMFIRKLLFVLRGVYEEGNCIWINDLPKHVVAIDEINYFWPAGVMKS